MESKLIMKEVKICKGEDDFKSPPVQAGHHLPDLLHLLPVDGVAGDVREVGELHVQGPELRQDAGQGGVQGRKKKE